MRKHMMNSLMQFLLQTQIASKILFGFWVFFSLFVNFAEESELQEQFEAFMLFMFPAIVNEICKNQILHKNNCIFLKYVQNTKTISRILLQLWVFVSLAGAGWKPKEYVLTFPVMAVFFLVPAFFIEKKVNPVLNHHLISCCHTKEKSDTFMNEKRKIGRNQPLSSNLALGALLCIIGVGLFCVGVFFELTTELEAMSLGLIGVVSALIGIGYMCGMFGNRTKSKKAEDRWQSYKEQYCGHIPTQSMESIIDDVLEDDSDYNEYEEFVDSTDVSSIDGMEGHDFEYYCAELLKNNGFSDVNVTRGSGDQGVDILAVKDGIKYAVQCKNYASSLSNTPVQEVNAGKTFYNCHVGVVMTNSIFTQGAIALAQATGVLLWDRDVVQKMMKAAHLK